MTYEDTMENIARVFEAVGVGVIIVGGLIALATSLRDFRNMSKLFNDVRRDFGRPLILGLEILVAADIIETVTVDPSLDSVAVLGILVVVRIALSFSLDIEVDGILPWRRVQTEARLRAAGESVPG